MLPLQQSFEVKQSILEYLKATFSFKEKETSDSFYGFIQDEEHGMFKGPYVSLKLPFKTNDESESTPLDIKPNFPPYKHQFESFKRLSSINGHKPKSTLLTTGTGSGKTESFLYPVLDYCYQKRDQQGIKVIILYPMNALATDQAKRLAETIFQDSRLNGSVTAGLFIGEGKNKGKFPKKMGEVNIIEDREEIISNPPDILLTNFKMLDYGLMRHQFHNLWSYNFENPELLQFLVLDELHTYDGAQGTDVANLIRRLKLKLNLSKGHLCPVGTSATIGKGEDSVKLLTEFASDVFGEDFGPESVITEHRLSPEEFFTIKEDQLDGYIPRLVGIQQSRLGVNENYLDYILRQKRLWQIPDSTSKFELSQELKKLKIVKDISSVCSDTIVSLKTLTEGLSERNVPYSQLPDYFEEGQFSPKEEIITSILALIAEAKSDPNERFPFLFLQIQIWIRELSGLVRVVSDQPEFTWRDKISPKEDPAALPPYYCRECGSSGWLAIKHDNRNQFEVDPLEVYEHYFTNHKNIYFVNTYDDKHFCIDEYEPETSITPYVHESDLKFEDQDSDQRVHVVAYRKVKEKKGQHVCPECNTQNSMSIIGTRVSTLNSITTSQILSSDLDEREEKYRKVLAFTNGVQDAAHQSGFIEARNYRFTFRTSLQKVINQQSGPISIDDLTNKFIEYWKSNSDPSGNDHREGYFYRFFPSDYMGKAEIEDYRNITTNQISKRFEEEFDTRISWEVVSEFGYNGMIGRTLEKTGSSVVGFNSDLIQSVYDQMSDWMKSNLMDTVGQEEFVKFVVGILHRIRLRGGVDHEYLTKFRTSDLKLWDLNWMKDGRHFLNRKYHPKSRIPKLVCTIPQTRGVLDTTHARTTNWFHTYLRKSFQQVPENSEMFNEFFTLLFENLVSIDLLSNKQSKDGSNFGINPKQLFVSTSIINYGCSECSSTLHIHDTNESFEGASCLNYRCSGKYKSFERTNFNYYNLVYNRSNSPRIYSSEHTGVLERKVRENIEIDFKERPKFNSLNSLVATSTLEMGIDVGSLDSAINTSIPPLTSNFLQRVGRAGRSSGSALITNFSQGKEHDLYYFEDPMEMMDGDINTPGCFLNAKDILYRHFTAFCIDSWTKQDPEKHHIPGFIKNLNLYGTKLTSLDFFVNQLLDFVFDYQKNLFDNFIKIYDGRVEDKIFEEIKTSVRQGSFQQKMVRVFEELKQELHFIRNKEQDIDNYIKENNLGKDDQERIELVSEQKSLRSFRKSIENKLTLEYLTNEGILPNYAFPETGVTLKAQVYGFKPEGGEREPIRKEYEIVRSSTAALSEFAPDNAFYSQGNKLNISGLNTFDWSGERSTLSKIRFCSNCDFIEEDVLSKTRDRSKGCPKCEHDSFFSESNVHDFAILKSVKSVNTRNESVLNDSKDDRLNEYYNISTHFNFDTKSIEGTWGMKKIPFGIEFVKDVEITKINLGSNVLDSNHITINQKEEVPRHGFVTCIYCGKSTSKPREVMNFEKKKFHYGYCKHKETNYTGVPNEIFKEVYLYRKIKTESLKILLPVQEFQNESTQLMFKSGLELGLKKYYKGNPSHIGFEFYSEHNKSTQRFDRYLVLFDKVPGGTGYLQKLFNPEEFTKLLTKSYESIRDCSCKNEGKDGCYKCILSYSNQYIRDELSREHAEHLFGKIVRSSKDWEEVNQGISSLTKTGMIEESELESKFVYSLKNYIEIHPQKNMKFKETKEDGIQVYILTLPIKDGEVTYLLRPQVSLGERDGVEISTRTDFLFKCIGLTRNGQTITDIDELMSFKDMSIYLDGYTYHASKEHLRFHDDIDIRESIGKTPNIRHWSLSWTDVVLFEKGEQDNLYFDKKKFKQTQRLIDQLPSSKEVNKNISDCQNSIERLLWVLSNSENPKQSIGYYFSLFQEEPGKNLIPKDLTDKFHSHDDNFSFDSSVKPSPDTFMFSGVTTSTELYKSRVMVRMKDLEPSVSFKIYNPENINKQEWEEFLRLYNLLSLI
ncbi:DEAD/DEAH box helicase domain-containing protein [Polaribacter sp. Hel1_33_96]|uniref:DEAD/DEAH box helicase n=1 Tax=Polaribacter sp. Hel1_33_96 TaxID=1336805 RepID=UPI000C700F87|nr:DEAD/DEAH box helicase [Polaribacter sp. Hel1_33_96]PKV65813.1 DEAD/DEAH box helicase domain-containing protein [Polaribacter sp. Hel1_33_96]